MKFNCNKGITLTALTVTIIMLMIVTATLVYNTKNQIAIKKIDNMYSDITLLNTKIDEYYMEYGTLPILCEYKNSIIKNRIDFEEYLDNLANAKEVVLSDAVNDNDSDEYYVINLELLDGLTLNYGYDEQYRTVKENEKVDDENIENELYIINQKTHQIYFPHGLIVNNYMYFTDKSVGEVKKQKIEGTLETSYGRIEIIWINKNNNVISSPLEPELYNDTENELIPVKWSANSQGNMEVKETLETDLNWYNYDNKKWANAKKIQNNNEDYFVWIPRFAYRIIYYENKDSNKITGYYDGRGLVDSIGKKINKLSYENGDVSTNIDSEIETVTYNEISYIVHPAFELNTDKGGWNSQLAGIWIEKYEHNNSESNITIDTAFSKSLNYDTEKASHLIKNSEWGAATYLSYSKFGIDGKNIVVGDSTTENETGIYELGDGKSEFVASVNIEDTNNYISTYGNSIYNNLDDLSYKKYIMKYNNESSSSEGTIIYNVGKNGDASKEIYNIDNQKLWFNNTSNILNSNNPFMIRGGNNTNTGMFYLNYSTGNSDANISYRIVLGK